MWKLKKQRAECYQYTHGGIKMMHQLECYSLQLQHYVYIEVRRQYVQSDSIADDIINQENKCSSVGRIYTWRKVKNELIHYTINTCLLTFVKLVYLTTTIYIIYLVMFASRYNFKAFVAFVFFQFPIKYQEFLMFLVFILHVKLILDSIPTTYSRILLYNDHVSI